MDSSHHYHLAGRSQSSLAYPIVSSLVLAEFLSHDPRKISRVVKFQYSEIIYIYILIIIDHPQYTGFHIIWVNIIFHYPELRPFGDDFPY